MKQVLLALTALCFFGGMGYAQHETPKSYTEEWKKIDALLKDNIQPKTALAEIQKLYSRALADKEYGQLVKAALYHISCQQMTEEQPAVAIISSLKQGIVHAPEPVKSVLYSLLAAQYKSYYQANRWRLYNRTATAEVPDDFQTWDATRLVAEALRYYNQSLQADELLKQTPVDGYEAMLGGDKSGRKYLPTLFDFLAKEALDTYSDRSLTLTRPQQSFVVNRPEYFADAKTFVSVAIKTDDTLSLEYQSLMLYQRLLAFRLGEYNATKGGEQLYPLVDLDIRRLRYVKEHGSYTDVDRLYEQALVAMQSTYRSHPEATRINYELAYLYATQGNSWKKGGNDKYRNRKVAAYELCTKIIQQNADTEMVKAAQQLQKEIKQPSLSLQLNEVEYPNQPILALASYKNVDTVYTYVYAINRGDENEIYQDIKKFVNGKKRVAYSSIKTVSQPDYQSYSAEVELNALPQGFYLVVVSNAADAFSWEDKSEEIISYSTIQVSSLNLLMQNSPSGRSQAYVTNRKTGKPLGNAQLDIYIRDYRSGNNEPKLAASVHTGATGIADIEGIDNNNSYLDRIEVRHSDGILISRPSVYNAYQSNRSERHVVLFTDRAIYRPGQTVYFKGLVYNAKGDEDKKLLVKTSVKVELKDVNWQTIQTQRITTNEYGTVQGSFSIPQGMLNGVMQLVVEGAEYCPIRVEEYKRPTFEVVFDTLKTNISFGDKVLVIGNAKALAGYAVDGAKVQYRVVRQPRYRLYRWWMPPVQREGERQIASGELRTDSNGVFTVEFTATADDIRDKDGVYDYTVTADITDANGETRSNNIAVPVSAKPLLVNVNIPKQVFADSTLLFAIQTTNLNGNVTPAEVKVSVSALQQPERILHKRLWSAPDTLILSKSDFEKSFPKDPYGDEDNVSKYKVLKQQLALTLNTKSDKQLDLSALKNAKPGWYRIEIKAKNEQGVEAETQAFVQLLSVEKPEAISSMDGWLTVIRNEGQPGSAAEFLVAGGESKSYVLYELLFKKQRVERRIVEVGTKPQRITVPIKEEYRGGVGVQLTMVQNNRIYSSLEEVNVPYTNKELDVKFTTFRDKLQPGEKEQWTLTVTDKAGEKQLAEMVAALYDASLDAFAVNSWKGFSYFYPQRSHGEFYWQHQGIGSTRTTSYYRYFSNALSYSFISYEYFKGINDENIAAVLQGKVAGVAFGASSQVIVRGRSSLAVAEAAPAPAPMAMKQEVSQGLAANSRLDVADVLAEDGMVAEEQAPLTEIATRQNFNETAFFYPQLRTNENGEILVDFTIPESLTRWKMLGFAHTKDFKVGSVTNTLITQKQVAVSANAPRFFREGDTIVVTAKVNNLTEEALNGKAMLRLYDAVTMNPVDAQLLRSEQSPAFNVKAGESTGLKWTLVVPAGLQALTYKLTAQAGVHTDGEEKTVPVLTNSMLVTESMPFSVRAGQQHSYTFERMKDNASSTLRNHKLTLELTSNPAWYAVQALPYLMEYPYECAEQVFSRFYANSLASAMANSSPKVKQVFELWSKLPDSQALLSNLEKNEELKQALLEETPWVMQANNETERKKRLSLLFDLNRMASEQQRAFSKLQKAQYANGGFAWFEGMPPSRFITQHIVAGIAHLGKLKALDAKYNTNDMVSKGLRYLDDCIKSDYDEVLKASKNNAKIEGIGATQLHYLYTCSFTEHRPSSADQRKAFDYYLGQAEAGWAKGSIYQQAMTALVMQRYGKQETAQKILRSLKERSQQSEEMGMYWRDNKAGYFWYQAPIETQALLIEAFNEAGNDSKSVEKMKIWLLRNKQTNDWKTTKATAEACYALLMTGSNLLSESKPLNVELGGKPLADIAKDDAKPEPGTGYLRTSWTGSDINRSMADLKVANQNGSGIAWGAMYWQYFEQLDKITRAETNLKMTKQLFLKKTTDKGLVLEPLTAQNVLQVGDVVKVRMELRADRDYEYVHLKDMRAAGFEPVSVLSGYRYQGGLGYYESIKDASTNFFIGYLPKGVYVFEYELRVSHSGDFSNGITTFQCMYAPEFSAHSEGVRVKVVNGE